MNPARTDLSPTQWRQIGIITLVAVAIFMTFRWLPTGTNLSHMDFRVTAKNSIDFCDPLNPQFIPVVAVASPVTMTVRVAEPAVAGHAVQGTLTFHTASGKPIAPQDLLYSHTKLLHLMITDPSLTDYQHVHPEPADTPGDWTFHFTPRYAGAYRLFADFTPAATARSLYANTGLDVAGGPGSRPPTVPPVRSWIGAQAGYRFALTPAIQPVRAGQPTDLKFSITHAAGGVVPLQPVMGAFAHLVAFDQARSGFAHLHPMEADVSQAPDARHPVLNFKIMIPRAGTYVIWAQVNLGGHETFVPFWFDVVP